MYDPNSVYIRYKQPREIKMVVRATFTICIIMLSTVLSPLSGFAQYKGGSEDGSATAQYLSTYQCSIPDPSTPPYQGGTEDGFASASYIGTGCSGYILSDIYKGGNEDGYSSSEHLSSYICYVPNIAEIPYTGGFGDGDNYGQYNSPITCSYLTSNIYTGGNGSGNSSGNYLSNQTCFASALASAAYLGGNQDGYSSNEYLSSYQCATPLLSEYPYIGGIGDGHDFNTSIGTTCGQYLVSDIYKGGNEDGYSSSEHLSSYICYVPVIAEVPYTGGNGDGDHYGTYLSNVNCSYIVSDIYKGGNQDGYGFGEVVQPGCYIIPITATVPYTGGQGEGYKAGQYLSSYICYIPVASIPPYKGGNGEGAHYSAYLSPYNCAITASYIYAGGNGSGNNSGSHISSYSCAVPYSLSNIYTGGSEDGSNYSAYVTSTTCINPPLVSNIYTGGIEDGHTLGQHLSSYICYTPLASIPPYQGGTGQGSHFSAYLSPYNCSIIASNIYSGGNGSGYNLNNYLSSYTCSIPYALSNIYTGGQQDGYAAANYTTSVTCINPPLVSNIYKGGSEDGYSYHTHLSSHICTSPLASIPPYIGGNNAGNAYGDYLSSFICGISLSQIYTGGSGDGYEAANMLSTYSCAVPSQLSNVYLGGNQDGYGMGDFNSGNTCIIPPITSNIYNGGAEDGYSWASHLSSYICYTPVASTPPYQGGEGQGWAGNIYLSPYTCSVIASAVYNGGTGSGYNNNSHISSYSCIIPSALSNIYLGGNQDGYGLGGWVSPVGCISSALASAAYYGGSEDGHTVAQHLSSHICTAVTASTPPYQGGFNSGSHYATYFSSYQCSVLASNIYKGGTEDGYMAGSHISPYTCYIPQLVSNIYLGGNQDGYSYGEVINPGCYIIPSTASVPYTGGFEDGYNSTQYLSSYQCVIPAVAEHPYIGGNGAGSHFNTFTGVTCGTYSASLIYYGGNDDGYSTAEKLSSYQCAVPAVAEYPYIGGNGTGDFVATYLSAYQCSYTTSAIYYGGNADGYAVNDYITSTTCIPSSITSAVYYGGNDDGYSSSSYLSAYQCAIPAIAEHPYIGGNEDGNAMSFWTGVSCSGYTTSAIYFGGFDDGYSVSEQLSNVICTIPVASTPPYQGGNGQGSFVATFTSSYTCSYIASAIYTGGNADGYAVNDYITAGNCISNPVLTNIYLGGNEDGYGYNSYVSAYQCIIPLASTPPYQGGIEDGASYSQWTGSTCSPYYASYIYTGGNNNGYAFNTHLSNQICYVPVAATPPYMGGFGAGSTFENFLSSITCNPIASQIYFGGNGDGYGIYDLATTLSLPVVNVSTPTTQICPLTPVTFTATPAVGTPPYLYTWFVNGIQTGTNSNTYVSSMLNDGDEIYAVMGAYVCSNVNYDTSNIITISHLPAATIPVFIAGADTLCAGQGSTYEAIALNATAIHYTIASGIANIDTVTGVVTSAITDFVVRATAKNACGNTFNDFSVKVIQTPVLTVTPDTAICLGASFNLIASGASNYIWSPAISLDNPNSATPLASPTVNTTYTVIGTTWTCSATEDVAVNINYCGQIWTGLVNNDWHNAGNWSLMVPIAQTNATIPTNPLGGNVFPVINAAAECKSLYLHPSSSLTINLGTQLSVYGHWTNNGVDLVGQGTVAFADDSIQNVTGVTTFGSMTVTALSEVNLVDAGQKASRIVLIDGILNSNGNLTLVSNALTTGLINGAGLGQVNGTLTQERFVPAAKAVGYKHFSTAFSNSTLIQFSGFMNLILGTTTNSPYPTLFKYSEAAATPYFGNGWVAAAPQGQVNNPIDVAVGYTAQFGSLTGNSRLASMYGLVNNGNITTPITRLNPGSGKGDGWNLVGNPYPSPLDLSKLDYTGAGINKSVSIFISTSVYNGYYGYYNAQINIPMNGGTRHLGSLHAFFVQRSVAGTGNITFTNAMRSTVVNPLLYKNDDEIPLFPIIKLSAVSSLADMIADETVITFHNDATEEEDSNYDIGKLWNTETSIPNLYSISNGLRLAMNGLPIPENNSVIPLGFKAATTGNYRIDAAEILNVQQGVWLEDVQKGTLTNLKYNPEYSFSFEASDPSEGRFFLRLGEEGTNGMPAQSDANTFSCWSFGNQIVISYTDNNGNTAKAELFDALGRRVFRADDIAPGMHSWKPGVAVGFYMLRFTYPEGNKTVKLYLE